MWQCSRFHSLARIGLFIVLGAMCHSVALAQTGAEASSSASGAVRLARFSYVDGAVTWRPDSSTDWSAATNNLPIRQGAQISVAADAKAEIQFDDGSALRITSGAVVTLKSLFSDADGEFTEVELNDGTAALHLKNQYSLYQVDTPDGSVKASGPGKLRLDASSRLKVALQEGRATLDTPDGNTTLHVGDFAEIQPGTSTPQLLDLPPTDDFDQFCDSRDAALAPPVDHLPSEIALTAGDLDSYGTWHTDANYGTVWCPTVRTAGWRPYMDGRWVWVDPFGWTWVSNEAWGWAPYHYGTWIYRPYGWVWVPGPRHQYWSPGVVHFTSYGSCVAWVPLCPTEVHYGAIEVGFRHGDWGMFFSVGAAAIYVPGGHDYCEARPWRNGYLNHDVYQHNTVVNITNVNVYNNVTVVNHNFVPHNARYSGATQVTVADFGRGGNYQPIGQDAVNRFKTGRVMESGGGRPLAGPPLVRPTIRSIAPTNTFTSPRSVTSVLSRPIYSAPVVNPTRNLGQPTHRTYPTNPSFGQSSGQASPGFHRGTAINGGPNTPNSSNSGWRAGQSRSTGPASPPVTGNTSVQSNPNSGWRSGQTRSSSQQTSVADAANRARQSLGWGGGSSSNTSSSSNRSVPGSSTSPRQGGGSTWPGTNSRSAGWGQSQNPGGWNQPRGGNAWGGTRGGSTQSAQNPPRTSGSTSDRGQRGNGSTTQTHRDNSKDNSKDNSDKKNGHG